MKRGIVVGTIVAALLFAFTLSLWAMSVQPMARGGCYYTKPYDENGNLCTTPAAQGCYTVDVPLPPWP
jgi:hypothetical protein